MKLSAAQTRILERIKAGGDLRFHAGLHGHHYWVGRGGVALSRTIWALQDKGLIAKHSEQWNGHRYKLTPAGRKLLKDNT